MSPPKREITNSQHQYLRINKNSQSIKKSLPSHSSSCSSSSTSSSAVVQQQHRHPLIIYTHSPKVIKTNPRDFMALVQKLTGLSRFGDNNNDHNKVVRTDDHQENEAAGCTGNVGHNLGGSCFESTPAVVDPDPLMNPNFLTVFTPNSSDFLCLNPMLLNHTTDPFSFSNSIPSSVGLQGMNEFCEY